MTKARAIGAAAAIFLLGLVAVIWPEVPHWSAKGTYSIASPSVSRTHAIPDCPQQGTTVAILGDSHVAGSRMIPAGGDVFGEAFGNQLADRVEVDLHGVGGDTAEMGESRWRERTLPGVDLVILAYGTNDAAPRGWLGSRSPVPLKAYRASLRRQVDAWRRRGSKVIFLAPPPGGSAAIAARLAPYREAMSNVGQELKVAVLDPVDAFASCSSAQPVLVRDALHMSATGHECLGKWLAHRLCPAEF